MNRSKYELSQPFTDRKTRVLTSGLVGSKPPNHRGSQVTRSPLEMTFVEYNDDGQLDALHLGWLKRMVDTAVKGKSKMRSQDRENSELGQTEDRCVFKSRIKSHRGRKGLRARFQAGWGTLSIIG